MIRLSPTLFALVPLLAGLAACSDSTGVSARTLSLSFGGSQPPASAASIGSASLSDVTSADGKLTISKVELVVREIELGEDRDDRNGTAERESANDDGDSQTCEVASSDARRESHEQPRPHREHPWTARRGAGAVPAGHPRVPATRPSAGSC